MFMPVGLISKIDLHARMLNKAIILSNLLTYSARLHAFYFPKHHVQGDPSTAAAVVVEPDGKTT